MKLTKIKKRNGRLVAFNKNKITKVILKAFLAVLDKDEKKWQKEADRLTAIVIDILKKTNKQKYPQVEQVQDIVEQVLMAANHYQVAKAYILYRQNRSQERLEKQVLGIGRGDLGLSINQLKVIESRYLLKDKNGQLIETPKQMFERVAKTLAKAEDKYGQDKSKWFKRFYQVMVEMKFLPAGRTLNNAGTAQNQLANCFVLPVEDSMEAIFESIKWMALIQQQGGGTGFNFSHLRPKGDVVTKSAGGFATGPVSFMKVFDVATQQVMQGGKKRGANMGILSDWHPDIFEFITSKSENGEIENFNLSVGISDKFIRAVQRGGNWKLINPRTGETVQTIEANTLFNQIATLAWRTGDPGLIFLDTINKSNPLLEAIGPIEATNVCGEQPLHPFDACNLGSINLAKHIIKTADRARFDWDELEETVRLAVRMLDDVIDVSTYPLEQIDYVVKKNRRIGLGVMGWADALYLLGLAYDSRPARKMAEKVAKFIYDVSWNESQRLAEERGPFPRFKISSFAKTGRTPVRNVAITTIAPTGSISMAAGASSGIEPIFGLSYTKNVVSQQGLYYTNPIFLDKLKQSGLAKAEILNQVNQSGGIQNIKEIPAGIKQVFKVAHDIAWQNHILMQAAWQKWIDNAVSKTINLPNSATIEDVKGAYLLAWKTGCKGMTVYRDGSKDYQVLERGQTKKKAKTSQPIIQSKLKIEPLTKRGKIGVCPECGAPLTLEEGCKKCYVCGWSACEG